MLGVFFSILNKLDPFHKNNKKKTFLLKIHFLFKLHAAKSIKIQKSCFCLIHTHSPHTHVCMYIYTNVLAFFFLQNIYLHAF